MSIAYLFVVYFYAKLRNLAHLCLNRRTLNVDELNQLVRQAIFDPILSIGIINLNGEAIKTN